MLCEKNFSQKNQFMSKFNFSSFLTWAVYDSSKLKKYISDFYGRLWKQILNIDFFFISLNSFFRSGLSRHCFFFFFFFPALIFLFIFPFLTPLLETFPPVCGIRFLWVGTVFLAQHLFCTVLSSWFGDLSTIQVSVHPSGSSSVRVCHRSQLMGQSPQLKLFSAECSSLSSVSTLGCPPQNSQLFSLCGSRSLASLCLHGSPSHF